jgi:hypothetical protein
MMGRLLLLSLLLQVICVSIAASSSFLPPFAVTSTVSTTTPAPAATSFPVIRMDLQLSFDLASMSDATSGQSEHCFPFVPNIAFQG